MTLTAITNDHRLFNPSALIESGESELDVVDQMRRLSALGLYCPHCYRRIGEMVPVKFRNPNERRKHFFHLDALGEGSECRNYSRESEDHMEAKMTLKEHLARRHPFATVEVEKLLQDGEEKRIPDVLVSFENGAKEAHEIQLSPINMDGLQPRTDDLKAMGCKVVWYLAQKNWTKENREYLRSVGVEYFKLYRHDGKFRWKPDEGDERPKQRPDSYTDNCGRSGESRKLSEKPKREEYRAPVNQADPAFLKAERERQRAMWEGTQSLDSEKELYQWFLSLTPSDLPPTPFELKPAAVVRDAERWYAATKPEVQQALDSTDYRTHTPRQRTRALQADLERLNVLLTTKS